MSVKAESNKSDVNMELLAPETILKTDDASAESKQQQEKEESVETEESPLKEDELRSLETLHESPVQWPKRLSMSDTPMYSPIAEPLSILTSADIVRINCLSKMTPDELMAKIRRMHDAIYQLGLLEAKEMTRGKLLAIFDRNPKRCT
ncbi:protein lin-52 homolog [Drosophila subobscura]|uniref:protein lin-52 homolog n=1 Tax=Drosophila subobscura TaxID=7241 RepID=UPI00155A917B|nr:protein lin-52 homolog [Drosophila subobscura]